MEEKNKGLNINIEHYTGEKPIEVVYRLGDAAQAQQPLATKAPEKISVSGTISTPYEWLSKRIDTVDQKRANVVVNREKMTIQLTVNEDDYYNKNTFTGTVEVSETFEKFGINDGEKGWIPAKLGQFLRLNRGLFEDKEKCMVLVSNLKNFNAKAKAEIEKQRDPSGSVADVYRCQYVGRLRCCHDQARLRALCRRSRLSHGQRCLRSKGKVCRNARHSLHRGHQGRCAEDG